MQAYTAFVLATGERREYVMKTSVFVGCSVDGFIARQDDALRAAGNPGGG